MKKLKTLFLLICLMLPFTFLGCENQAKTRLATPEIVGVDNGMIIFNKVEHADYYTLMLNDIPFTIDVKYGEYVEIIDNQVYYNASKILEANKSYALTIRAEADNYVSSDYSKVYSHTHTGSLMSPENVMVNTDTKMLSWDIVENADYYLVKVITPYDTLIYDHDGKILTSTDAISIGKSNLTEYKSTKAQYYFSSLLTKAGEYKFYVCAVGDSKSIYTSATNTYLYQKELSTPNICSADEVDGDIILTIVVDDNANAIEISSGDFTREVELNNTEASISMQDNLLYVNANEYFENVTKNGKYLDFTQDKIKFSTIAKYLSNSNKPIYLNSISSNEYVYTKSKVLDTVALNETNLVFISETNEYMLSWDKVVGDIDGYKVYTVTNNGVTTITLDKNTTSTMLDGDFYAVGVLALGTFDNHNSRLNNFAYNPDFSIYTGEGLDIKYNNGVLSWNKVSNAQYIVDTGDNIYVTNNGSIEVSLLDSLEDIYVTQIINGRSTTTEVINLYKVEKLPSPIITDRQGFASANKYLLTFSKVEEAIGYYVYMRVSNDTEFEKINNILYTSTSIDLTSELSGLNNLDNIEIKIQAIAGEYNRFLDSTLSDTVVMNNVEVLKSPKFYQTNGKDNPIVILENGGETKYELHFYEVSYANSYEIIINGNRLVVPASNNANENMLYKQNVTQYLSSANVYRVKVRAIADSQSNLLSSEYNEEYIYPLYQQLDMVTDIHVEEENGVYTLSYTPPSNAPSNTTYRVRIVKLHDNNYEGYLNNKGLSSTFYVRTSSDITEYVKDKGEYNIYMTAVPPTGTYYGESDESSTFAIMKNLITLDTPRDIEFSSVSKDSFVVTWTGDEHADYYIVRIERPNGQSVEYRVFDEMAEINDIINMQGTYTAYITAMVNVTSENAGLFENSPAGKMTTYYVYQEEYDFLRSTNSMYDVQFDYAINDIQELKSALWYHYLYGVDFGLKNGTGLSLYLVLEEKEDETIETVREAIIRLANEANELDVSLYNFNTDEVWLEYISDTSRNDNTLFDYLAKKLLSLYPELHSLEGFNLTRSTTNNQVFELNYKNGLDGAKTPTEEQYISTAKDYSNNFTYLSDASRRNASTVFGIDQISSYQLVTTTEQLMACVQSGKQPLFIGDYATAEKVYNNAKTLLLAIVNDKMSEVEKVTAIFDWLEYAYTLNLNAEKIYKLGGYLEDGDMSEYGSRSEFYLEGIFLNLCDESENLDNGGFYLGNRIATAESYSKAFTLLCAIEGIKSVIVNGEYQYTINDVVYTKLHTWNKVYLSTTTTGAKAWYNVDLTFSDNRLYMTTTGYSKDSSYGMSSHSYFLVMDEYLKNENNANNDEFKLQFIDKNYKKSKVYSDTRTCNTYYDYYSNSSYRLTKAELNSISLELGDVSTIEYSKMYNSSTTYQGYAKTPEIGNKDNYYLNGLLYAQHLKNNNPNGVSTFEFRMKISDNGGLNAFTRAPINNVRVKAQQEYSITLSLKDDGINELYYTYDAIHNVLTIVYVCY